MNEAPTAMLTSNCLSPLWALLIAQLMLFVRQGDSIAQKWSSLVFLKVAL